MIIKIDVKKNDSECSHLAKVRVYRISQISGAHTSGKKGEI